MGKVELDIGIDPELLAQAKRLGISVAGMSETQLRLHLQKIDPAGAEERARRWSQENAEAIKELNRFVEEHGAFGDDLRTW
ncbi:post-segregation antitoxin CcdA [Caulobacter sp. Root487D2Y]|uniref:type II toxin-antitoxin system CcdA family antitoxin n=1 Tax=Caulobacter sp. Root487D2Y TaxID=1736547 RepID=UPI0006FF04C2|nr:type II toxin-antitoxin system CcdA family antitoxin [Caulobacter sp. Root487D2Y]KQY27349.1 post-segregation antitoxin CcdA [Caulobacter sp. Root487D2Y]